MVTSDLNTGRILLDLEPHSGKVLLVSPQGSAKRLPEGMDISESIWACLRTTKNKYVPIDGIDPGPFYANQEGREEWQAWVRMNYAKAVGWLKDTFERSGSRLAEDVEFANRSRNAEQISKAWAYVAGQLQCPVSEPRNRAASAAMPIRLAMHLQMMLSIGGDRAYKWDGQRPPLVMRPPLETYEVIKCQV